MATLEQLAEGIRRAHAAGNAEHVRILGQAYRQMQAQQQGGPIRLTGKVEPMTEGVMPSENVEVRQPTAQQRYDKALQGVRQFYPDLTDEQFAERARQQLAPHDALGLLNQGLTFGLGDEAAGAAGFMYGLTTGQDPMKAFGAWQSLDQARRELGREQQGVLGTVSELGGTILGGRPDLSVQRAPGLVPGLLQAGKEGALQGAVYGAAATEGDLGDRVEGAIKGAGVGGIGGVVVNAASRGIGNMVTNAAQRRATNAAIKGAPDAADLKAASLALFKQVDDAGVTVAPKKFTTFVTDLVRRAVKDRMNPTLDPKAYAAFTEIARAANEMSRGGVLTVSDLHTLRQIAQKAAMSAEGRDAMFANRLIEALDDFVTKPSNLQGSGNVGKTLMEAISTWGRARRVGMIEEAITKAQTYQSGFENGLRLQFQALLKNPRTRRLFNQAELQAIREVANGTALSNAVRILSKFGFGPNNMLGGTIGATIGFGAGGVPGMLASGAIGAGARKVNAALANRAANRAAQVVATPNIPQITPLPMLGFERAGQSLLRGAQSQLVNR